MSKNKTGYLTLYNFKDTLTLWQQWHQTDPHNREESLEIYSLIYGQMSAEQFTEERAGFSRNGATTMRHLYGKKDFVSL